jgi:AraC-like DNA-binding protein
MPRVGEPPEFGPGTGDELARFVQCLPPPAADMPRELRQLLTYIHTHLFDAALNVNEARRSCGILDNNVSCRFRYHMGVSIRDYIEDLRMQAARLLLDKPELSVFEVTRALGYSHPQTFYRAFRRRFQSTPAACRDEQASGVKS